MLNKNILANIKEIFLIPRHMFIFLVSLFVRRRPDVWVFSSRHGVEGGPLAVAQATRAAQLPLRVVWLTHSESS